MDRTNWLQRVMTRCYGQEATTPVMVSQFLRNVPTSKLQLILFFIGAVLIAGYFIWFAGGGVHADCSGDDWMNMHDALARGTLSTHLTRSLLFFLPAYRPSGAFLYLLTYEIGGMNPLLLHVVCLSLALLNLVLMFLFIARTFGSREIGLVSTMIGAFHGGFIVLYYDSGNFFDLLSFPFFYSPLFIYISVRQRHGNPGALSTAAVLILFAISLGAKEIALSFPFILLSHKLIWSP